MPRPRRRKHETRQRRWLLTLLSLMVLGPLQGACTFETVPSPIDSDGFGAGGLVGTGASSSGGFGTGGFTDAGGTFTGGGSNCSGNIVYSDLASQAIPTWRPTAQVLYSWTNQEDEDALRGGDPLIEPESAEVESRGFALDQLFAWALGHPDSIEAALTPRFDGARGAWPHPWAARIQPGGEDAGARLIRIALKPDAWVARLARHGEVVEIYDTYQGDVTFEQAAETPERIALIYFLNLGEEANLTCGSTETRAQGEGYRQFIVGNQDMLESYEVGSELVLQELMNDATALSQYLELIRPCPATVFEPFATNVICNWGYTGDPFMEVLTYPGDAYRPTAAHVADLIELLEDSLFEPDPYVVQPGVSP